MAIAAMPPCNFPIATNQTDQMQQQHHQIDIVAAKVQGNLENDSEGNELSLGSGSNVNVAQAFHGKSKWSFRGGKKCFAISRSRGGKVLGVLKIKERTLCAAHAHMHMKKWWIKGR